MNDYYNRFKRTEVTTASTSLDELVDENEIVPQKRHKSSSSSRRKHTRGFDDDYDEDDRHKRRKIDANDQESDDDEIDPIDAYMKNLEDETNTKHEGKPIIVDMDGSDSEDNVDGNSKRGTDEIDAAPVASNPTNRLVKHLNMLSQRDVEYAPFRKNFYVEVPELAELSEKDVKELRESLENITVVGKSCPKPVKCWAHCGLSRKVMDVLKKFKFSSPTPIQAQAIPAIMSGRDVIGIAKTGCGKTLSFLLPMFRHLEQPRTQKTEGPIAVIITPTRELATQICDDASRFTRVLGLKVVAIYGGPNISEQIALLKTRADIVVCTPGRMIEVLISNGGRVTNLNSCTFLVLDEADRLFDMGFEKQITSIVNLIRPDRQTVMFSATFPKIMEAQARKILNKPIEILVGGRSIVCKDVLQAVQVIEEDDKFPKLIQILRKYVDDKNSAIIFVARQEKADYLLESLMKSYDSECLVLHGGIDKDDRISTFASFKSGQKRVLVATSIAARGLDVKNCILVVNYDCPNHYEDYVHRCGRTGRAGNKGFSFTFITPEQAQHANSIIKALEASEVPVPEELRKLWEDYKAEQERLGKKVWSSSGFSGKGYKFDAAESQLSNEKKKYVKKSLGIQNSDDEDEGDVDSDNENVNSRLKTHTNNKTTKPVGARLCSSQTTSSSTDNVACQPKSVSENSNISPELSAKIARAQQIAIIIFAEKVQLETLTYATAPPIIDTNISKYVATQKAEMKNNGQKNPTALTTTPAKAPTAIATSPVPVVASPEDTSEPSEATAIGDRFEMDLEINNCDQLIRRRLTSKDILNKISEQYETGITVRGTYCEPSKKTAERKLYLALESKSKYMVERAYIELQKIIKDEEIKLKLAPIKGRYKIL